MNYRNLILLVCFLIPVFSSKAAFAQYEDGIITLPEALDLALINNHSIAIQRIDAEIAQREANPGNAGLLPTITTESAFDYTNSEQDLVLRTFQSNPSQISINESGVQSVVFTTSVLANYTLFAGFASQKRYELLKSLNEIEKIELELQANQILTSVTSLYSEAVRLHRQLALLNEIVLNNRARLSTIKDRRNFGRATSLDVLRAQTELNSDITNRDNIELAYQRIKRDLSIALNIPISSEYDVEMFSAPQIPSSLDQILIEVKNENPSIKIAKQGIKVSETELSVSNSSWYPRLEIFGGVNLRDETNDVQQVAELNTISGVAGLRLRYDLFAGGTRKQKADVSKMKIKSAALLEDQIQKTVAGNAIQEFETLKTLDEQLIRERQNLSTFEESFKRMREQFNLGNATEIEFKDAQNSLLNAEIQIINVETQLVESYQRLQALRGKLVAFD